MFCKLEGKPDHYVPYSQMSKGNISAIVEIKFENLNAEQFKKAAKSVQWCELTNLKKIHVISSEFDDYNFPENSLPKLEVIEFENCHLSGKPLNSLLDAVPGIDTMQNFKFTWDEYSSKPIGTFFDDGDREAFQSALKRIKKIQNAQNIHEQRSEESTVDDDDLDYGLSDQFLLDVNEEIEITYYMRGSSDPTKVSSEVFFSMSTAKQSYITEIEIDANGMPLLGAVSFDGCTNLASLSISNAIIEGNYHNVPLLPKLNSLHLDSCGVNVEGVGYFINNGSTRPRVTMLNITKVDGDVFEKAEFNEFGDQLSSMFPLVKFESITAEKSSDDSSLYSGTSHSDSEHLEGNVVLNASRLNAENLRQLDGFHRSNQSDMQIDGDEGSIQVGILTKKKQDDQDADTLSTLSGDDDLDLDALSDVEILRTIVPLPLPLSPGFTGNLKTAQPEILCYFSSGETIPYTKIDQRALGNIVRVTYHGLGHADDAMAKLPWAQLTGLRSLHISNALVASDAPFQSQDKRIFFPNLVEMTFSKCKLGSKALGGFVNRASPDLTKLEISRDCDIVLAREMIEILRLKSKVNTRSREADFFRSPDTDRGNTLNPHRREDNVGAGAGVGAGNDRRAFTGRHNSNVNPNGTTTHTSTHLPNQPPGQQGGHLPSRRRSSLLGNGNGRTSDGSSMPGGVSGRKNESRVDTGGGGNTIPNMHVSSQASLYGAKSRHQSRNQSGFPESTGPARFDPVRQYKNRPVMVVGNEAAIRNYEKLCEDTDAALDMIKEEATVGNENYSFVKAGDKATRIVYKDRGNIIPILDASIDTVRVHRRWREVDKDISDEARAKIIIASLGIPPCPPDIDISNENSRLGKAIREQFNQLKLADPAIYVRRIDR